jgi:hypothetical protein
MERFFKASNYRLQLTARLFLAERPQLKRSVRLISYYGGDHE